MHGSISSRGRGSGRHGGGVGWLGRGNEAIAKAVVAAVVSALGVGGAGGVEVSALGDQHGVARPALHALDALARFHIGVALGAERQRAGGRGDGR